MNTCPDAELSIAFDKERFGESTLPRSTNEFELLKILDARSDIMYTFNSKSLELKEKIQGYLGSYLFKELGWFKSFNFSIQPRESLNSTSIKSGTRANRIVIEDVDGFNEILDITTSNLKPFIEPTEWSRDLERLTYDQYGSQEETKKS